MTAEERWDEIRKLAGEDLIILNAKIEGHVHSLSDNQKGFVGSSFFSAPAAPIKIQEECGGLTPSLTS